jgi:hypothetical protein
MFKDMLSAFPHTFQTLLKILPSCATDDTGNWPVPVSDDDGVAGRWKYSRINFLFC